MVISFQFQDMGPKTKTDTSRPKKRKAKPKNASQPPAEEEYDDDKEGIAQKRPRRVRQRYLNETKTKYSHLRWVQHWCQGCPNFSDHRV